VVVSVKFVFILLVIVHNCSCSRNLRTASEPYRKGCIDVMSFVCIDLPAVRYESYPIDGDSWDSGRTAHDANEQGQ